MSRTAGKKNIAYFKNASDSIDWGVLWYTIRKKGVSERIIDKLYKKLCAVVLNFV
jgi:hypothetical protein